MCSLWDAVAKTGISASFGVISSLGGAWGARGRGGQIERFIAPDVNIYYGFSGGALVDVDGSIIGLEYFGTDARFGRDDSFLNSDARGERSADERPCEARLSWRRACTRYPCRTDATGWWF